MTGPRNPFLADSGYSIGPGRCDQQDNTPGRGPEGPTEVLGVDDVRYAWRGPGHFGGLVSSPYADGRRVIWSNGREAIVKLGYDTLEVLGSAPGAPSRRIARGMHKSSGILPPASSASPGVNTTVSSPNSVPFVAQACDLVYTCGSRDGQWTIEAVDWTTGIERFHSVLGGSQFNTLGAGVTIDDDGRLLFGNIFGKTRILRAPV